ncbi:hypothetical protein DPX16_11780 [Anabarilius grahami]|uniref:Uncharacterized protein n=1 Tax=Anabarilius grahami TaxID=495550 RepID=A0A3N0Z839_ANAGA|nr:hypothetical protein DPX16_11780 [Anabarilius grahami]
MKHLNHLNLFQPVATQERFDMERQGEKRSAKRGREEAVIVGSEQLISFKACSCEGGGNVCVSRYVCGQPHGADTSLWDLPSPAQSTQTKPRDQSILQYKQSSRALLASLKLRGFDDEKQLSVLASENELFENIMREQSALVQRHKSTEWITLRESTQTTKAPRSLASPAFLTLKEKWQTVSALVKKSTSPHNCRRSLLLLQGILAHPVAFSAAIIPKELRPLLSNLSLSTDVQPIRSLVSPSPSVQAEPEKSMAVLILEGSTGQQMPVTGGLPGP